MHDLEMDPPSAASAIALQINQPNGIAGLDGAAKISVNQLPTDAMEYKGAYNATTNSPSLTDGTGNAGDFYVISVAGTRNFGSGAITFAVGDAVIYSGSVYQKIPAADLVLSVAGKVGAVTLVAADITDLGSATVTFTNKRITKRVVSVSDATSVTLTGDSADINTQANTQGAGTLTMNAPSGTPTDGQGLVFRIKSTNVQTYSWNAIFRGSTSIPLPTASSGAALTDYLGFIYNSADSKWDILAYNAGF